MDAAVLGPWLEQVFPFWTLARTIEATCFTKTSSSCLDYFLVPKKYGEIAKVTVPQGLRHEFATHVPVAMQLLGEVKDVTWVPVLRPVAQAPAEVTGPAPVSDAWSSWPGWSLIEQLQGTGPRSNAAILQPDTRQVAVLGSLLTAWHAQAGQELESFGID